MYSALFGTTLMDCYVSAKHIALFGVIYGVITPEDSFFGVNILSEFLESFYVKYGSFIPLSHTDVLEYLKKNGNTDLSHRFVDTNTQLMLAIRFV